MPGLIGGVLLFVGGGVASWLIQYLAPGVWKRVVRRPAVRVHVELDPALIHAGSLNWDGYAYVIPADIDPGAAPTPLCREWRRWIWPSGAFDAWSTELKVTVLGLEETTVLIDGMRIQIESKEPTSGRVLGCPVGGAEGSPRHVDVDLDMDGLVTYMADGGEMQTRPFSFTLSRGEVETFWIVARARSTVSYRWTAELLLIVDGEREVIDVWDNGDPFRTAGADGLMAHTWSGSEWVPNL